jgi:hypothetical protein
MRLVAAEQPKKFWQASKSAWWRPTGHPVAGPGALLGGARWLAESVERVAAGNRADTETFWLFVLRDS